jgi:hypothetical protein
MYSVHCTTHPAFKFELLRKITAHCQASVLIYLFEYENYSEPLLKWQLNFKLWFYVLKWPKDGLVISWNIHPLIHVPYDTIACVYILYCGCYVFCNVRVCICVYFVICECTDNCVGVFVICVLVFVFCIDCTVFLLYRLCTYLFVLSVLVKGLLPPSENSIAISK